MQLYVRLFDIVVYTFVQFRKTDARTRLTIIICTPLRLLDVLTVKIHRENKSYHSILLPLKSMNIYGIYIYTHVKEEIANAENALAARNNTRGTTLMNIYKKIANIENIYEARALYVFPRLGM